MKIVTKEPGMRRCRICDVPDENGLCSPCEELEMRVDTLISCEPERAVQYLEHKLNATKQKMTEERLEAKVAVNG